MNVPPPKAEGQEGYECLPVRDPVCGSDGKTYSNKCELTVTQCKGYSRVVAGGGPCTANSFDCSATCPASPDLVCGSDKQTFDNDCFLNFAKYCSPGDISRAVASKGGCVSNLGDPDPVNSGTANGWASANHAQSLTPRYRHNHRHPHRLRLQIVSRPISTWSIAVISIRNVPSIRAIAGTSTRSITGFTTIQNLSSVRANADTINDLMR